MCRYVIGMRRSSSNLVNSNLILGIYHGNAQVKFEFGYGPIIFDSYHSLT
jgi:hypothetical protein